MIDGITYEMWVLLWGIFFLALGFGKYAAGKLDEAGRSIETAKDENGKLIEEEHHGPPFV